jgi:hypothetical protein
MNLVHIWKYEQEEHDEHDEQDMLNDRQMVYTRMVSALL